MNSARGATVLAGLLCAVLPLAAHHSTAGYDKTKTVPIKGVVAGVTWMNPHAQMLMDVQDANGKTTRWIVELAAAGVLKGRGWLKGDVKPGDEMTIDAWLSKDGSARAVGRFVHLPDGRTIPGLSAWDCTSAAQAGCAGMGKLAPAER